MGFDGAGVLVDFGSFARAVAFVKAVAASGVEVTIEEVRPRMGMGRLETFRAQRQTLQWSPTLQ